MVMANAVTVPKGWSTLSEPGQCRPCLPAKADGDESTGSPAASITAVPVEKGTISSLKDDSSLDKTHGDECTISVELPTDKFLQPWWELGQ